MQVRKAVRRKKSTIAKNSVETKAPVKTKAAMDTKSLLEAETTACGSKLQPACIVSESLGLASSHTAFSQSGKAICMVHLHCIPSCISPARCCLLAYADRCRAQHLHKICQGTNACRKANSAAACAVVQVPQLHRQCLLQLKCPSVWMSSLQVMLATVLSLQLDLLETAAVMVLQTYKVQLQLPGPYSTACCCD